MFEVGQRIRTTNIDYSDEPPAWQVGNTGTIVFLGWHGQPWAAVRFDQWNGEDIVNFDEMEIIYD